MPCTGTPAQIAHLIGAVYRKEAATTPYTDSLHTCDFGLNRQVGQFVEHRATYQCVQIGANSDVGRRLPGLRIKLNAQWMLPIKRDLILEAGMKQQLLLLTLATDRQADGDKGRVVDLDRPALHRRYQVVARVFVKPEDG